MGQNCTVHVKVLLKLVWAVTFQSTDHKHGYLAAKTGSVGTGPLTDNKREKLWRLFFFYVPIYFYLYLYLWYNHGTLDLRLFVYTSNMPPRTITGPLFAWIDSNWISFKTQKWSKIRHVTVWWWCNFLFELIWSESEWSPASMPTAAAGTTTHTASDVVLCMYSRWWLMSCTLLLLTVDGD